MAHPGPTPGEVTSLARLQGIVRAALAMSGELDQGTLITTALDAALQLLPASSTSFWSINEEEATCHLARGSNAAALRGNSVAVITLVGDEQVAPSARVIVAGVVTGGRTIGYLRASRADDDALPPFEHADLDILALLAECTASALRMSSRLKANDRSSDIKLVQELSREIGSSLDLDRVLQTVVNIAARALTFDRGALALYEGGKCDIRAVAGSATVDSSAADMQDLAFRAAWAAGTGDMLYVTDRESPESDSERIFLQFFGDDLEKADASSGLYIPLRDEEGIVGILLFEANRAEFASERERDLMMILANQATVAIRNAKLYSQVPLAEAFGAFSARRAQFLAIPRQRRAVATVMAVALLAAVTLIRWPLRVLAEEPVFHPLTFADVRSMVEGTVDRVLVKEGTDVAPGEAIAQLRDIEARASRAMTEASLRSASRSASLAASRGDATEQRLQGIREEAARAELVLRDQELAALTLRAPVHGVVLTARPELLVDTKLSAGQPFVRLGRTDTLDLEFKVGQEEINRVHAGDEVRIRIDALPQRTFSGRVSVVGALPETSTTEVRYLVRAVVPNDAGVIRPGMAAYARVLTAPESLAWRLLRTPVRVLRLLWWRSWSWL